MLRDCKLKAAKAQQHDTDDTPAPASPHSGNFAAKCNEWKKILNKFFFCCCTYLTVACGKKKIIENVVKISLVKIIHLVFLLLNVARIKLRLTCDTLCYCCCCRSALLCLQHHQHLLKLVVASKWQIEKENLKRIIFYLCGLCPSECLVGQLAGWLTVGSVDFNDSVATA